MLGARRGGCARGPEQRTCPGQIRWHVHVPQQANRAPSKLRAVWPHRDVPSFLQYPDGSHSLGVITPVGAREEEEEAGAGNQSGTITGSFVVWADPSATPGMPPCCCCALSVRPFARLSVPTAVSHAPMRLLLSAPPRHSRPLHPRRCVPLSSCPERPGPRFSARSMRTHRL